MSGHSKWSTIKRQKAVNDQARGKVFSKLSKAISVAVKTGGGPNPDANYKLKVAIDAAKAENMPKDTIDRAIQRANESGPMDEVTYECFGPDGVQIIIEAATDNRNRTAQELKTLLERSGGNMGGPGSVSFNFKPTGYLEVKKQGDVDDQMLDMIDKGVEEIEDAGEVLEAYVPSDQLFAKKDELVASGYDVSHTELIQKPITTVPSNEKLEEKVVALLEKIDNQDDVQKVFTNLG